MDSEKPVATVQLPYKPEDYAYQVMWSEEDQAYVARVAEFDFLAAHGASPAAALHEITDVVHFVLEDLVESGEDIPAPFSKRHFSGKLHLRMSEYLHRQLTREAAEQRVSLNQWINLKLSLAPSRV